MCVIEDRVIRICDAGNRLKNVASSVDEKIKSEFENAVDLLSNMTAGATDMKCVSGFGIVNACRCSEDLCNDASVTSYFAALIIAPMTSLLVY